MYVCMYFGSRMNRTVAECFLQHNDAIFLIGEPGRYCKREGGEREREKGSLAFMSHIFIWEGGREGRAGGRERGREGRAGGRERGRERGREGGEGGKGAEGGREGGRKGGREGREEREGREGREGGRKEGRVRRCATHCQEVST